MTLLRRYCTKPSDSTTDTTTTTADPNAGTGITQTAPSAAPLVSSKVSSLYEREEKSVGGFKQALNAVSVVREKKDTLYSDPEFRETQLGRVPDEYTLIRGINKDGNFERAAMLKNTKTMPAFVLCCAVLFFGTTYYFGFIQENRKYAKIAHKDEAVVHVGTPRLGGPFELTNTKTGKKMKSSDLHGKWLYIYFGFTNCPDVCPDEMKKLTFVTDRMAAVTDDFQPLFITVDPARDGCEEVEDYLQEFHPDIMGLTGTQEEIDKVAKLFRVFYAVPDIETFTADDYLVDHSIITYLMDPEGKFSEYTTKEYSTVEAFQKVKQTVTQYENKMFRELSQQSQHVKA